jgi:hypothetical protein
MLAGSRVDGPRNGGVPSCVVFVADVCQVKPKFLMRSEFTINVVLK